MPLLSSVLLVDDDATTNFLNKLLLSRMGIAGQVLTAENGEEALRLLSQAHDEAQGAAGFQLVLLDLNMPVLNGLAFLELYAQLPPARQLHTIIVMLTTSLNPVDRARAEQLPIAGFLNKPLTRDKVNGLLAEHFGQPQPQGEH